MNSEKSPCRIGIFEPRIDGWTAGQRYIGVLVRSLESACETAGIELFVFREPQAGFQQDRDAPTKVISLASPRYIRGEWSLRSLMGLPDKTGLLKAARERRVSVLLPMRNVPFRSSIVRTIGWIPDFQHVYLPQFFSDANVRSRDQAFRRLAQRSTLVMISSRDAAQHFGAFLPEHARKMRVVPFPSMFAFEAPQGDVFTTQRKFNLPQKFALVANQFWQHKNHEVVVEAIRQLRCRGLRLHVVMTGQLVDYRDPNNETTSRILQAIACAGISRDITVLGKVADADLISLMRMAAVVIQPSRFEGWSTVVQDCKALGRPLICSDIPVHREQAPEALGFFHCDQPNALADLLAETWSTLEPGPDPKAECRSLALEREFGRLHGQSLLSICHEAASSKIR